MQNSGGDVDGARGEQVNARLLTPRRPRQHHQRGSKERKRSVFLGPQPPRKNERGRLVFFQGFFLQG